jgi:hypothetical protein
MLDRETMSQMDKATELLKPLLWMRDGRAVRQIRQASTAVDLFVPEVLITARGKQAGIDV